MCVCVCVYICAYISELSVLSPCVTRGRLILARWVMGARLTWKRCGTRGLTASCCVLHECRPMEKRFVGRVLPMNIVFHISPSILLFPSLKNVFLILSMQRMELFAISSLSFSFSSFCQRFFRKFHF